MTEAPQWEGPLPEPVRQRVVAMAADTLGALEDDEVPVALKPFRSWAPARRTRLAATPLAVALERDVLFRQRTHTRVREQQPELAEALEAGSPPLAADPVDVAAVAYLGRTPGWGALVAAAGAELDRADAEAASNKSAEAVERLQAELADARRAREDELVVLRGEVAAAREELAAVARELREEKGARRRAERVAAEAEESAASVRAEAADTVASAEDALRRVQARQVEAEAVLASARAAAREGRNLEDTRLRLLLDTVVAAAAGLRRELALPPLPPPGERPADLVEALHPGDAVAGAPERALLSDDPALLDQLLALPQVHLVVDGYNVTKTGYPELSLDAQRTRLVTGLAALAARSGAEVTCCFDGATLHGRVPALSARGVRVLFSKPDEIADELIRRLVRAEPPGRAVVVVSSDREVADGVRRAGARPVSAVALVRRLDRG